MTQRAEFDRIEVFLVRVLQTLITERSVSRAAMRLQSTQPAVSAQLKRLRALTGDPLLVRAGNGMVPTSAALQLLDPATRLLQDAERLFGPRSRRRGFEPLSSTATFRIAASDYLDPLFLPELVAHLKREAPSVRLELLPLSGEFDYRRSLASGEVDLVIGNWLEPPEELHLGKLMSDEIVCLVAEDHPAVRSAASNSLRGAAPDPLRSAAPDPVGSAALDPLRGPASTRPLRRAAAGPSRSAASNASRTAAPDASRGASANSSSSKDAATRWTVERYLSCEHVAPTPLHANAPGVIDQHLASLGKSRDVMVRSAHFSLIPLMVAQTLLVLTTGRLFCSRYVDALPVRIVRCPVAFPPLTYYQLWHDLTHASASVKWLREQARDVARNLSGHGMPQRGRGVGTADAAVADAAAADAAAGAVGAAAAPRPH